MYKKSSIIILLFLSGCGFTKLNTISTFSSNVNHKYSDTLDVIYTSGNNELNSVECYIKKDLVMDGFVKAAYYLTGIDKSRIYEVIKDIDWSIFPDNMRGINSLTAESLWIRFGNIEKRIAWDIYGEPKNEKEQILKKLGNVLSDILYNNPVFKSMPKPRGGRL